MSYASSISSYPTPGSFKEPCEGDGCPQIATKTWYCVSCDCSFCDTCWDKQPAHRPKKRGADGYGHERIDKLVVERYRSILEPSSNAEEQEALHRDDEDTTWFGIGRDDADDPVFEDYGRFAALMQDSLPRPGAVRHPQLVSFIGQTGAGKSTVVKMLINHQDMKTNQTLTAKFAAPLPGNVNDNVPVSANVHLYADPDSYLSDTPILYADCEGLEGGESIPKAEAYRAQDTSVTPYTQRSSSSEPRSRKKLHKKGNRVARNLKWAHGDKEKSKREYAVTELYPKLLYTFSDVVVFVLRNSKTFESAVLTKLVGWASASFEKSLGQPALPHVIIVLNATDLAIDASQWDVDEATSKLLSSVQTAINTIPSLQDHVAWWRANGRVIHTTKDLLECYYSSVTVVRIPMKGRYMLIDQQVEKLHTEIMLKSNQSHYKKQKVRMLSNSEDLQLYLQLAFDHFAQDLDTPFDFVSVALKINPIPSDFGGNILKLAVSIRNRHGSWKVVEIFERLSLMVASCIMLDIHRHRRLGTPSYLLDTYYMSYCERAFTDFCDMHWPCNFRKGKLQCAKVEVGHNTQGHQTAQGKVIASGDYIPSFHYNRDLRQWIQSLEREMAKIEYAKDTSRPSVNAENATPAIHVENLRSFYSNIGSASDFKSHCTCFCCLREVPLHPLTCGHVLCSPCVHSYGTPIEAGLIEISLCPVCLPEERRPYPATTVQFKPKLAGVRVLCLDGGGMRGIVELEVLRAIERQLPVGIPIRSFFDLIVGTSTGGIIAIGLGIEGWSTQTCMEHFERLCATAFTPRELHKIPVLGKLEVINNDYARYKAKPFERVLQEAFSVSGQPLFGGQHNHWQSSVKTAVTATSETGDQAVLLTNYNRSHEKDDRSEYWFERADLPEKELNVWEAARATSAAPTYFKSFRSTRNNHGYLDGALYHNNPVRVADLERRLIWPETEDSPPDILLSIGTSCNDAIHNEVQRNAGLSRQRKPAMGSRPSSTIISGPRRIFTRKHKKSQPRKWFNILVNRIENILDTEMRWLTFMSEAGRGDELNRLRYHRINPNIREDPPRLDEVKKLPHLRQRMIHVMKEQGFQNKVGQVARRLVASSFYVEAPAKPHSIHGLDTSASVEIRCRFPSDSREIRRLGDYLKNVSTLKFKPHFTFAEQDSGTKPQEIQITVAVIETMMMNASFHLETVHIPVSNENAIVTGTLSLVPGEDLPISGFPRALASKKAANVPRLPARSESQRHPKSRHVVRPMSFPDDTSSQQSEGSDTAFPEIQQLPKEAKLLIWRFLREKIDALTNRDEEVPAKMTLVERACDVDSEDDEDGLEPSYGNGPYGTVLHTACAIGIKWIVEMQIKARVDVTTLDDHHWTALMIAKVQGHAACSKILADYMEEIGANIVAAPLWPTELVQAGPGSPVFVDGEYFMALPATRIYEIAQKRIQVRANHPIPPNDTFFYFEMSIINNGPLGIMGIGLCRPGTDTSGMPGWHPTSWGYHGDDGMKYHGDEGMRFHKNNGEGLKYSVTYHANDTVGCGINRQTGKMFFTKNGVYLGIAFRNVTGILYPMIGFGEKEAEAHVNFGASNFVYNINAHRWGSEDRFVDLPISSITTTSRQAPGTRAELPSRPTPANRVELP
ncbi:MAG: hypothetical protein Q9213_007807 [Squamulea squamosa]